MKEFSVLMSVYARERGDFLRLSLDSVFNQSTIPSQVVLVEDGALTDELYGVINSFKTLYPEILHIVKLPKNVGLGNALNEGLKHCRFELVARMDSDDICRPERFETQVDYMVKNPQIAIVGSWVDEFDSQSMEFTSTRKLPTEAEDVMRFAKSRCPLNHPSVMFRKSIIEEVGSYKPIHLFEDYYLWARVLSHGYHIANIGQSLLNFRSSSSMIARRGGWKYATSEVRLMSKMYRMGFISFWKMSLNIAIRFPIRIMPNKFRAFIYSKLLR